MEFREQKREEGINKVEEVSLRRVKRTEKEVEIEKERSRDTLREVHKDNVQDSRCRAGARQALRGAGC